LHESEDEKLAEQDNNTYSEFEHFEICYEFLKENKSILSRNNSINSLVEWRLD